MRPIRVLIVEDSPVVREHLRRIISADPRLEIAGLAASAEEALVLLNHLSPDVISMDIHLPGMSGLQATRRIMEDRPTPIVVVSGIASEEMNLTMEALKAGALSAVEKPAATGHEAYDAMAQRLCTQLAIMSEVKVLRQKRFAPGSDRRPVKPAGPVPVAWAGLSTPCSARHRLLGLAASTGGPNALAQLLTDLGPGFPLPVAVVQHMAPGFIEGFASWLAGVTRFPVEIVGGPTPLKAGKVYMAPSDWHLAVNSDSGWLEGGPPVGSHRPSATALFASMARNFGAGAIGVLLTGMGDDGAAGLRELRAAGGFTIAEHESTAVVYGMPAAAVRMGGARESLPLGAIAPRILELVETTGESF